MVLKLLPRLKFFKSRSNFKVKVTRSKIRYQVIGLVTRNAHVQYESPITSSKKVMLLFTHTRFEGYDISSPDVPPGSLKSRSNIKVKVKR